MNKNITWIVIIIAIVAIGWWIGSNSASSGPETDPTMQNKSIVPDRTDVMPAVEPAQPGMMAPEPEPAMEPAPAMTPQVTVPMMTQEVK